MDQFVNKIVLVLTQDGRIIVVSRCNPAVHAFSGATHTHTHSQPTNKPARVVPMWCQRGEAGNHDVSNREKVVACSGHPVARPNVQLLSCAFSFFANFVGFSPKRRHGDLSAPPLAVVPCP